MTMFVLDKSESTFLLMPGTYWRPQWILCTLKVDGPALCVCIPWRVFAVMVALVGSILSALD